MSFNDMLDSGRSATCFVWVVQHEMKPGRRPLRHTGWPPLAWNFPTVIVYFCVQPIYLLLRSRDQKSVVERDEPGASNALYSVGRNRPVVRPNLRCRSKNRTNFLSVTIH